jgi:photosystem II stability/assembly factor-like uncharacterized protein
MITTTSLNTKRRIFFKKIRQAVIIGIISTLGVSSSVLGQWQQSAGTNGLNMQSLLSNGIYNFAGGATGAYLSTNSSASYSLSNTGNDNVGPTRGFAKDDNYVYTCTSQGVFRSSDNGATWVPKNSGLTNLLTSGILKVGSNLFVVSPTGVFKSSNNADNWSSAGLTTTDVRCIGAINTTLFVGTNGSGIYKSVDSGLNWTAVNNGLGSNTNFRAIESKGNTLFAAGQTGSGVFRSTDLGANWVLLSGGLPSSSYRGFASNTQLIVAGSFGSGVFYSTNNGDNWTAINSGLTDLTIFDLEINDSYIIAATNTQGVFRFALSNLNLSAETADLEGKNSTAIYPNPTTDQINLKIDTKYLGSNYSVYDKTGKSVLSGLINLENSIIKLDNLSTDTYYMFIEGQKQTLKVIKQ